MSNRIDNLIDAIDLYGDSQYASIPYNHVYETDNFFVFVLGSTKSSISDLVGVNKKTGECKGYLPFDDPSYKHNGALPKPNN